MGTSSSMYSRVQPSPDHTLYEITVRKIFDDVPIFEPPLRYFMSRRYIIYGFSFKQKKLYVWMTRSEYAALSEDIPVRVGHRTAWLVSLRPTTVEEVQKLYPESLMQEVRAGPLDKPSNKKKFYNP